MKYDIIAKLTGHGYHMQAEFGEYDEEPSDAQLSHVKEQCIGSFRHFFARDPETVVVRKHPRADDRETG